MTTFVLIHEYQGRRPVYHLDACHSGAGADRHASIASSRRITGRHRARLDVAVPWGKQNTFGIGHIQMRCEFLGLLWRHPPWGVLRGFGHALAGLVCASLRLRLFAGRWLSGR